MMPLNRTLEEDYDDVVAGDRSVDSYTYGTDTITIDLNDLNEDVNMTDFSVTSVPGVGSLPNDFYITTNTNSDLDLDFSNIVLSTPHEDFCEYIGLDKEQSVEDFQDMCERYPSLQKALEQFTNTYNLVKDDWQTERKK